jgi:hypothetical protein
MMMIARVKNPMDLITKKIETSLISRDDDKMHQSFYQRIIPITEALCHTVEAEKQAKYCWVVDLQN